MNLHFDLSFAEGYKSKAQIARVLTEKWFERNMYCPICGQQAIRRAVPNAPVKDFICAGCKSQYELKSKNTQSSSFSSSVPDGVYDTMISRITSSDNPSFFFLHYSDYEVNNLVVVPKWFFVPDVIEKRAPLSPIARRAGWEGCNIKLGEIPDSVKIPIIVNKAVRPSCEVVSAYQKLFSLHTNNMEGRGWLFDILWCIERLGSCFTLQQIYSFSDELRLKHPSNHFIHHKIRQQLQLLRDRGFLEFVGRGVYRKV